MTQQPAPDKIPNASWPTPSLMTSLANAGWGDLSGRDMQGVRSTLHALVAQLPWRSGAGKATVWDVASRAGLSTKWTARCLRLLEDLGVIEWTRGGITVETAAKRYGTPGWVRIVKARLVALIFAARPWRDERLAEHRAETLARIAKIRTRYTRTKLRNRRSDHMELSADPTPTSGRDGARGARVVPDDHVKASHEPPAAALTDGRGSAAPARRAVAYRPECEHGWPVGERKRDGHLVCPDCRRDER